MVHIDILICINTHPGVGTRVVEVLVRLLPSPVGVIDVEVVHPLELVPIATIVEPDPRRCRQSSEESGDEFWVESGWVRGKR